MTSIDGRIQANEWSMPYGNDMINYIKEYREIGKSFNADALIFGLNTIKNFFPNRYKASTHIARYHNKVHKAPRKYKKYVIFPDTYGEIDYGTSTFRDYDILVILSNDISDEYKFYLEKTGISYITVGQNGFDMEEALDVLWSRFGVKTIMLKGGGIMNGAMLSRGLISEVSICIYPGIDGLTGDKSAFEYVGSIESFKRDFSLELISSKAMDNGMVWTHYKVHVNKKIGYSIFDEIR